MLLSKFQEAQDAERVADKLREALHPPFPIAGSEVAVAVAIGTAHHPADGRDAATLLRRAVARGVRCGLGPVTGSNHLERGAAGGRATTNSND